MTTRFDEWLAYNARQEQLIGALFLLAFAVVAVVWYAHQKGHNLLWFALGGFWSSLLALVALNPPAIPEFTFGALLDKPLWYDEIFTWHMANLPLGDMLQATAGDVHPPLWYTLEHFVIRAIGDSEAALRLPSVVFSVISVGLCYQLARELGHGKRQAVGAAALLALMPGHVFYAQEARMYALLEMAVLLATLGVVTRRYLFLMGVGMALTLYSHNLGIFYVLPIGLLSIYLEYEDGLPWRSVGTGTGVLATWSPWLVTLLRQSRDISDGFWIQPCGLAGYLMPFYRVTMDMGIAPFLQQHGVVLSGGVLGLAVWAGLGKRFRDWLPLHMIITPTAGLILASELWQPVYLHRFFIAVVPFLAILLSVGLSKLQIRSRTAILAALVPMMLLGLLWQRKGTERYRDWVAEMEAHLEPGDVMYHANLASYITLSYYLPEAHHVVHPAAGDLEQSLTIPTQEAMGIERRRAEEIDADRLWVLWAENPLTTVDEIEAMERALSLGDSHQVTEWHTETDLVRTEVWEVER
jgi:hypothetical protein